MDTKTYGIILGILAVVGGGLAYVEIKKLLDKGTLVIDTSSKMPSLISDTIHAGKWLPKKIPFKLLIGSAVGVDKNKNREALRKISDYFTFDVQY